MSIAPHTGQPCAGHKTPLLTQPPSSSLPGKPRGLSPTRYTLGSYCWIRMYNMWLHISSTVCTPVKQPPPGPWTQWGVQNTCTCPPSITSNKGCIMRVLTVQVANLSMAMHIVPRRRTIICRCRCHFLKLLPKRAAWTKAHMAQDLASQRKLCQTIVEHLS